MKDYKFEKTNKDKRARVYRQARIRHREPKIYRADKFSQIFGWLIIAAIVFYAVYTVFGGR